MHVCDFLLSLSDEQYMECTSHPEGDTLFEVVQAWAKINRPELTITNEVRE